MPPRLADRLRTLADHLDSDEESVLREAAAELDRREARLTEERDSVDHLADRLEKAAIARDALRTENARLMEELASMASVRDIANATAHDAEAKLDGAALSSKSVAMHHARSQAHTDGYRTGWHAALGRVADGDAVDDLSQLCPKPQANEPKV